MKRVAIYIRVSTTEQAQEGYSLSAQERTLRGYCDDKGYKVADIYADEGISAKDIKHRPEMLRLLNDARHHKFDIVLVWKLSRFTRSLADLCEMCKILELRGVSLVSYSEPFDDSTSMGKCMRSILGVFAQLERDTISENVRAAMDERARRGLRTCSYILGYDTIKGGGMTINHEEAEIVRYIYNTYLDVKCISDVSDMCQALGYRGKMGGVLDRQNIYVILTRFLYCGFYSWHRQPIPGDFEPIIEIPTYNKVQQYLLDRGEKYGRGRKYPLVILPFDPHAPHGGATKF